MLFMGIPGYVLEPDGNIACLDCTINFILENGYAPTDDVSELATLFNTGNMRVRRWEADDLEDIWIRDMEA